ncbi:uncharacterized protein LOC131013557 [Salvia miltiorrhiza]|uniref:uncharacterized protein LOC131013557 n=1 Tax=Salvia miltiorrhiza TaxID=226208 RepID=UPI0025AB9318|nr:uncharacterized protein LOC131013557 [Salvia miltiorrhiza]
MESMPPSDENGWVNPRRPLNRPPVDLILKNLRPPPRNPSPISTSKSKETPIPTSKTEETPICMFSPYPSSISTNHPRYGRLRRPPTAMTDESGGLAGGGRLVDGRDLCKSAGGSLSKSSTDPYWIRGGSYGWSADFDWESDDDMSSMENEEDLVDPYFPFPKEGETWDAAVEEAERQMKEEGLYSVGIAD